ncbi:MAG: redox-regulated ATPase YchF [Candidatus Nanoarchaeia archaeon]|nr:redox-regulated ATPase YchF [Candidatus Nanoarchaeia archaeon]MDD5499532.1 redox-regulated ATPase YchF [Candidatus Nanoarchaeia archaeon]
MLVGIVGKPNTGKSTFFKAATLMDVVIENYPFATIKPNRGIGHARVECAEKEFNVKCNPRNGFCIGGIRYAGFELMDVAGLVPGAHEGKGMGNQFLDDLRQADAFIHVIDISGSTNEKGENVSAGAYNPSNDIKFLEDELDYWFFGILKNSWQKFARRIEQGKKELDKEIASQFSGLKITEEHVKEAIKGFDSANAGNWSDEDLFKFCSLLRKISKPMVIAANKIDKSNGIENLERLKKEFPDYKVIGCSAEIELALREANNKGIIEYAPGWVNFKILKNVADEKIIKALDFMNNFLKNNGSTGIQDVLDYIVFNLLNRIAVFPGGTKGLIDSHGRVLPDCFLLPKGSTALDFAYAIHTDLGDKFIKAINVKTRQVLGKAYELKHRDVIEIITS